MKAARSDEALVQALKGVALDTQALADLRQLYDTPAGVEYAPEATKPNRRIVRRCRALGRRIGQSMGRAPRGGRDLIGYCDPDTATWRMRPAFRALMRELGWVDDVAGKTLVDELDACDDSRELDALAALIAQQEEAIRSSECLAEADREELLKARFGQGRFRVAVAAFESGCRATGVTEPGLLQAAHIKPWATCSNRERLDGANGLLLTPSYHLLFSKGYISFDPAGRLLVSAALPDRVVQGWSVAQSASPRGFARRQLDYLEHHRTRLFKR
ncbi:HNH endonuclease [Ramlibacter sp.]|uniref:HNH endonuclease n=1 Tax=Ramlibacter sp. TaxID=1917967 RepID=UPI002CE90F25|nr:HNH endonuclease [Ramlibacter sp.]HWI83671.1 HNH endonuclease [Ramlibacter sp.]